MFLAVVLATASDSSETLLRLATESINQGYYFTALEYLREAKGLNPQDPEIYYQLGLVYYYVSRYDSALAAFRRAWALDSTNLKALFEMAYLSVETGDTDQAVRYYRELLRRDPGHHEGHYNLGMIYYDRGQYDDAAREFRLAHQANPEDEASLLMLGNALWEAGDLEGAEEAYRGALGIDPEYRKAHWNLSLLYQERGDTARAMEELRAILEADPSDVEAAEELASLCLAQGDVACAREVYQDMAQANPYDPDVLFEVARFYEDQGDSELALRYYRKVIDLDPERGEAYYRAAVVLGAAEEGPSEALLRLLMGAGGESTPLPSVYVAGISYDSKYLQDKLYLDTVYIVDIPALWSYAYYGKYASSDMAFFLTLGSTNVTGRRAEYSYYDRLYFETEVLWYKKGYTLLAGVSSYLYPNLEIYQGAGEVWQYTSLKAGLYWFTPIYLAPLLRRKDEGLELDLFGAWRPGVADLRDAVHWETEVSQDIPMGEFKLSLSWWQRWDLDGRAGLDRTSVSGDLRYSHQFPWGTVSMSAGLGYAWVVDWRFNALGSGGYWSLGLGYTKYNF